MVVNNVIIFFIKLYKLFLSPILGHRCRFYPTCSSYGVEVFQRHLFHKAVWLLILRIIKCHPFNSGGYDPVPASEKKL